MVDKLRLNQKTNMSEQNEKEVKSNKVCKLCKHQECLTCNQCHNINCFLFGEPLKSCFNALLPQSLEEKGKHQISQERIHEIYKEIKEREEKQNPPTDSNWDNGELTFDYIRSIVDICNVKDVEIQSESVTVSFVPKNATGDSWKLLQEKILQLTKK